MFFHKEAFVLLLIKSNIWVYGILLHVVKMRLLKQPNFKGDDNFILTETAVDFI